jgi:hypothetical protein
MKPVALVGVVAVAVFGVGVGVGSARAAAPAPDPPPLAVAPDLPQQAAEPGPASPVSRAPAVTRTVVRTVVTPVDATQEAPARREVAPAAKRKPPAKAKRTSPVPKPKRKPVAVASRPQSTHDRPLLPLAAAAEVGVAVKELDRGSLALAGGGLAFVALGGAVLLLATRRQLEELSR